MYTYLKKEGIPKFEVCEYTGESFTINSTKYQQNLEIVTNRHVHWDQEKFVCWKTRVKQSHDMTLSL
jgi:ribosomal protein L31